jgi:PleD family two-component response regulator
LNGAITIAEKLLLKISGTAFGDDLKIKTTMTFGVSEYDADTNIAQFISKVDMLLHKGKENGRNQVVAPGS